MTEDKDLLAAIMTCLNDPSATVATLTSGPIGKGFADAMAGGEGLILHKGTARTAGGVKEFSLVEKLCRVLLNGNSPDDWLYWKREALAYASGALNDMPSGTRAPLCYGVTFTDAPSARIFIEVIPNAQPSWTDALYGQSARCLGHMNARMTHWKSIKDQSWMAPGRAQSWLEIATETLNALPHLHATPELQVWLKGDSYERTRNLWAQASTLTAALQDLETCFCHHDAFQRNILIAPTAQGADEMVIIDWAFAGQGVLGEELAAAIGAPLVFNDLSVADAPRISEVMFTNYLVGLREEGWKGAEADVRLGYTATTALFMGLGAFGTWLPLLQDAGASPVVESITGLPRKEFLANLGRIQPFFLDLGEEALTLAAGRTARAKLSAP